MMFPGSQACWNFVVDFGDIAVLAPATCAICVTLWLRGQSREALIWGMSFAGCVAITIFLKAAIGSVEFDLFGHRFPSKSPPSGHTAMSVAFYGGLAAFLRAALPGWIGGAAAAFLVSLAGLIAISTIILEWHTDIDVVAGLLLGGAFTAFLARTARLRSHSRLDGLALGLAALIVISALHGFRLDVKVETLSQGYSDKMSMDLRRERACLSASVNGVAARASPWSNSLHRGSPAAYATRSC
jgi:hypothetical protein